MMRPEEVQIQAAALRSAVSRGDFVRAARAAELYCQALRSSVREAHRSEAPGLVLEARDLLDWARRNLRAHRARLASRLRDTQRLARYHTRPPVSPHTWTLRG